MHNHCPAAEFALYSIYDNFCLFFFNFQLALNVGSGFLLTLA